MVNTDVMEVGSQVREHGPCHRCGWVTDVSRAGRKTGRELGVSSRMRLCDECCTDLRHSSIVTLGTHVNAWTSLKVAHRRHVA